MWRLPEKLEGSLVSSSALPEKLEAALFWNGPNTGMAPAEVVATELQLEQPGTAPNPCWDASGELVVVEHKELQS